MTGPAAHSTPTPDTAGTSVANSGELAPWPGVHSMPRWDLGDLPNAPIFRWKNLAALVGPGLVLGAAAIGGGEWLTGPLNTARFGGALLWLSTLSIIFQAIYNLEIMRYALYTGEPIFTGKFRLLPGPGFWLTFYLILDIGAFLPYLASNAAIPAMSLYLGYVPENATVAYGFQLKMLACVILVAVMLPLSVGGKVYDSLKGLMLFKLVLVMSFLSVLALLYSTPSTWKEIGSGFFKFGNIPVVAEGDLNGNGVRDPGEPELGPNVKNIFVEKAEGRPFPAIDLTVVGILGVMVAISGNGGLTNTPMSNYTRDQGWGMGRFVGAIPTMVGGQEISLSHVGMVFRENPENLSRWKGWLRHIRREQLLVWVPACFIGLALPSMLSVQFLPRGTVLKDKYVAAGMTADGVGSAVSGLRPDQFLPRRPAAEPNLVASDELPKATEAVTTTRWVLGRTFWTLTLFCGFLVLATSCATTAEGTLRRWVDVMWTASSHMRSIDPKFIGTFYFLVLWGYTGIGILFLLFVPPDALLTLTGMLYNYALGISCFHTVAVTQLLLPKALRPHPGVQVMLIFGGIFFTFAAVLTTYSDWTKILAVFGLAG